VQKIKKHIPAVLATCSLLLALLSFFFFERGALGAAEETYFSAVKERIKHELSVSQEEIERITALVAQNTNTQFSDLRQTTKYPYYIYQNGRLIFWSDYRFIPDYEAIHKISQTQLVSFDQSKYLVSRRQFTRPNARIDVVSVINLYRHYKNENNYLQSGYNTTLFTVDPELISTNFGPAYQNVLDNQNRFLFSIIPPKFDSYHNQTAPVNTITWGILAAVLFGIYIIQWVITLSKKKRYEMAFLLLMMYLVFLRAGMLYFGIPFLFSENDLFNPKFYASSPIAPSLGDFLLNCLVCFILALYVADFYFRSKAYLFLVNISKKVQPVL